MLLLGYYETLNINFILLKRWIVFRHYRINITDLEMAFIKWELMTFSLFLRQT